MKNETLIATLNDLVHTCNDCEEGFRACAEESFEQHFKVPFRDRAIDCATASRALQALLLEHGGEPRTSASIGVSPLRRWIGIKQAILAKSDRAVLDECERGEDLALLSYRNALGKNLPPAVRAIVEIQYQGVLRSHALVRLLRDDIQLAL